MMLPACRDRRSVDRLLSRFFQEYRLGDFRRAIGRVARFYGLRPPRVAWFEYLDWGRTAGRTYENGAVHLVHPENWKNGRKYNSERQWVHTVYHEMGHYVLWADAERKADGFAYRFVSGVSCERRARPLAVARRSGSRQAAAALRRSRLRRRPRQSRSR